MLTIKYEDLIRTKKSLKYRGKIWEKLLEIKKKHANLHLLLFFLNSNYSGTHMVKKKEKKKRKSKTSGQPLTEPKIYNILLFFKNAL